jgi:hypothetical protein
MPERLNIVNIAIGACIAALGVVLLLHSFGVLQLAPLIRYWPIVLVVIGLAITAQAVIGSERPAPAPVGLVILILVGGLVATHINSMRAGAVSGPTVGRIDSVTVMGGNKPQLPQGAFMGGQIATVMGGTQLDLRQATNGPGTTTDLELFTVMGGVDLWVPSNWRVENDTLFIMGGLEDKRPHSGDTTVDPTAPRLVIHGSIVMGGLTLRP